MTTLSVPRRGLLLDNGSKTNSSEGGGPPTQTMQLDLTGGTIDELLKTARKGNPIHVAFWKDNRKCFTLLLLNNHRFPEQ